MIGSGAAGVETISAAALAAVDVFVVNSLRTPLSPEEICRLETFVRKGGAVLETRNRPVRGQDNQAGLSDRVDVRDIQITTTVS